MASRVDLSPDDQRFAASVLHPHELALFAAAPAPDRRHGVAVARRVRERLGDDPRWARAALLHDAGKARAPFGVAARSLVTLAATAAPVRAARCEEKAEQFEARSRLLSPVGVRWRAGAYLAHGPLAAAWLQRQGSEQEVVEWVRVHHRQELWPETGLPGEVLLALASCDF